jgi:hypothetical protein
MLRIFKSALAVALVLAVGSMAEARGRGNNSSNGSRGDRSTVRRDTVRDNDRVSGQTTTRDRKVSPRKVSKPERIGKGGARDYYQRHGKRFRYGYYYPGRNHKHWTHRWYSHRHHCYYYWCPSRRCYYFWSGKRNGYYPVSSIDQIGADGDQDGDDDEGDEDPPTPEEEE